ncbi:MAG: hypothetical protein WCE38_21475 [Burkholderiales bacterium]
MARARGGWRAWAPVLAFALPLAACYPELDWREVSSASGGYTVLMPARPDTAQREVVVGGVALMMSMTSVRREGMAFGAAYADIPRNDARDAELLAAARDALVRNIDGRIASTREIEIDGAAGQEFQADGKVGGHPMRLAARVLIGGSRFYQVVYVGRAGSLPEADANLFLGSFRLVAK